MGEAEGREGGRGAVKTKWKKGGGEVKRGAIFNFWIMGKNTKINEGVMIRNNIHTHSHKTIQLMNDSNDPYDLKGLAHG